MDCTRVECRNLEVHTIGQWTFAYPLIKELRIR